MKSSYYYNVGLAYTEIVKSVADRPAFRFANGKEVTHAAFDALANRLAAVLLKRGVRRRDVIAIVHTKSLSCYALVLAALKLGVAYVNLDDQNPPARLKHIFATSCPRFVFSEEMSGALRTAAEDAGVDMLQYCDPRLQKDIEEASAEPPPGGDLITAGDPAYIMYTSGSTGIPKGAIMTHGNVLNFGAWIGQRFGVGPKDVLTNVNPMYFDNSVFDFYGGLLNGATIAPVTRETLADPSAMLAQIEAAGCTLWFSVPSLLIYLTTLRLLRAERLPSIRSFVFGGEGYPKPELRKLYAAFGSRSKLINVYGPTECTCMCSAWDVREKDLEDANGLVTLGPVAANFSMLVLDGDRQIEPGEVGELCLLGPQVGLGYANDTERTAAAFVSNPLNGAWSERMYRTGDLVRLGGDGKMLDFVGRRDNQIKHMGYRIELEEIESALNQVDGVVQSAVLLRSGRRTLKLLVAYIATERSFTESALFDALSNYLPPYMIPQRFVIQADLPKNANGKVDRIALAAEQFEDAPSEK